MAAAEQKCLCVAVPSVLKQQGENVFSGMQIGPTTEAFKREENAKIPSFLPVQDKNKDISKEEVSAEKFLSSLIAEVVLIIDKKRCLGLELQDELISIVTEMKTNKKVHFSSPLISNVFEIEEEINSSQDTIPVDSEEDLISFDQCTTNSWYNFIRTKPSFDNLDEILDKEIEINSKDNEKKCTEDQLIVEISNKNKAASYKFDDFLKEEQLIENENLVLQDSDFLKSQYVLKNDKLSLDEQTVNNSEKKKQDRCRENFSTKVQNIQRGFDALFINKNQTDSQYKENPKTKNTVNLLGGSISQELSSLIGKDADEGKAEEWYRKKVQQKFKGKGKTLDRPITCWCKNENNNASRHDACIDEAENQFLLSEEQLVPNIDLESTTCLNYVKSEIFHDCELDKSDLSLSSQVKDNLVEQINLSPVSIENSEDSFYAQSLHSQESILSQDSKVDLFSSNANIKDDEFNRKIGQEIVKSGTFETVSEYIENCMMKFEQSERQTPPTRNEEEIASQAPVSESKSTEQHDEQKLEQCERQTQPNRNEEEIASQAPVSESKSTEQHDEQKLEQCERQTQPTKTEEEIASQAPVSGGKDTEQDNEQKLEQCGRQTQPTKTEEEIASQALVSESRDMEQHDEKKLEQCERQTQPTRNEEEIASQAPVSESKSTEQHDEKKLEQCERQTQPTRNEEEIASQAPVSESKSTEQHEKRKLEQCERQTHPMPNIDDSKVAIQLNDGNHKTNLEVASPCESVHDDTNIYSYRKTEEDDPKLAQLENLNWRHSNHTESVLIGQEYHLPHAISYTPEEDYIENSEGFEVDVNSSNFIGLFEADNGKASYTIAETDGGLQGFLNLPEGETAQTISREMVRQVQHITDGNNQAGISYTEIPTAASENALGGIKTHENLNSCVEDTRINLDMMDSGSHQQQRSKKLRLERSSESPNIHVMEEKTAGEQQCLSEDDQVAEARLSFTSETSEAGFYNDVLLTRKGTDKTPDQINISIPDVHEPPNKMKKKDKGNTLKKGDDNPAAFTWSARRKLFSEKIEINEESLEGKSFYSGENNDQRVVPCLEATPSSKCSNGRDVSRGLRLGLSRRKNTNRLHPYWSSARIRSDRQVVPDLAIIDDGCEE